MTTKVKSGVIDQSAITAHQYGPVLLSSQTASAVAQLDFTGLTGYSFYQFILQGVRPASDNVNLLMRLSTDNGSSFVATGVYHHAHVRSHQDSSGGHVGATGATSFAVVDNQDNGVTTSISGEVKLLHVDQAPMDKEIIWQFHQYHDTLFHTCRTGAGGAAITSVCNAVRFLFSGGNIAAGNIKCYGWR